MHDVKSGLLIGHIEKTIFEIFQKYVIWEK